MNSIEYAARSLFKKGGHDGMKIISLGIGLAVALVLVAKMYFEQSFDKFYPDANRIYRLAENIEQQGSDEKIYMQVPGAVTPTMQSEIPGVEVATRLTALVFGNTTFTTPEKQRYTADNILFADTNLFNIFPRPVLMGDARRILATPFQVMISRSLAEKMGGIDKVEGMKIRADKYAGFDMIISGVFEDVPENSHLRYDILISMETYNPRSRNNWIGNDRYLGYVKLAPGITPESLKSDIRAMFERHVDVKELTKNGIELSFSLVPLMEMHASNESVLNLLRMLGIIAFALLFTAVMNYILISISSIVNRTKEIAVRKSYGASEMNIHGLVVSETLLHMLLALALALFLIYASRSWIYQLLDVSVKTLLLSKGVLFLLAVCAVVFLVTACVPGFLFARIPVAAAFRSFKELRRIWKLGLLFLQFIAVSLLICLLLVVGRQYHFMMNDNPGYAYDRLAYCDIMAVDSTRRANLLDEIHRLPSVEQVTTVYQLPLDGGSGNNIYLPEDTRELFNVCDQYWCGNGYLQMLEVPVIEGDYFTENVAVSDEVMVSRAFVEKMNELTDWSDGAVGKYIQVTEHDKYGLGPVDYYRICGVYEDYRIGSLVSLDTRPSVLFYRTNPNNTLAVKFKVVTHEAVEKVRNVLQELVPDQDLQLFLYSSLIEDAYSSARKFRDQVLVGGLAAFVIALIGLIGYTNDEVNRRRKELAIRKINGATLRDLLSLFLAGVMKIAFPAVVIGCVGAYLIAEQWLQQFALKIPLAFWIFLLGGVAVLLVVAICVGYRTCLAANENPVKHIKSE